MRCELFRIEDEVIDTGIEEIDNELIGDDYDGTSESGTSTIIGVAQLLYVVGTGVTATANTSLVNNGVRFLRLTNRGAGYSSLPSVGIASVGIAGSVTGIGTVSQMIGGINVCNTNTNTKLKSVQQVAIVNPGTGYTTAPTIKFSGGGGSGAAATSGISTTGGVGVVTVSSSGGGYINAPTVTFSTPKHVGAAATAVLATPMVGGGVSITSAPISVGSSAFLFPGGTTGGAFYRTAPTVTFALPTGTGNVALASATIANASQPGIIQNMNNVNAGSGYQADETVSLVPNNVSMGGTDAVIRIDSVNGSGGVTGFTTVSGGIDFEVGSNPSNDFYEARGGSGNNNFRVQITSVSQALGGVVSSLGITTGGRFYTSVPTVTIAHPGTSVAIATVGLAGSSIDPGSVAFSTTGRAYTTAPTVAIATVGTYAPAPLVTAVGIATIHPVSGVVTAVGFNSTTDAWAVGTGATVGAGYTVAPTISFSGSPSPIRATATATISDAGVVIGLTTTNAGFGYISPPTVSIASPGGADENFRALGIATIRFNSLHYQGTVGIGSTTITGINTLGVIVGDRVRLGIGYSDSYNFIAENAFVSGIGQSSLIMSTAATNVGIATSVFELGRDQCGIVTGIAVTFGGGGYLEPPTVSISNTVGDKNYIDYHDTLGIATATGISTLTSAGAVEKIYITDSGHGYVITPTITVEDPASDSSGTFKFNEIITGSSSGTTARVRIWNESTNQLEVMNVNGSFVQGETLTGSESGAQYVLRTSETFPPLTNFADNNAIETEADAILDFSEENPFGTP